MKAYPLQACRETWIAIFPAAMAPALPVCSAARRKNPGTSSPTSPAHPAQTIRVPGPAPKFPFAQVCPERATSLQTAAPARVRIPHAHRSRCRSPRLCRIFPRCSNSSRVLDRRGTFPCSARKEAARARGFPARFSGGDSQASLAPVFAVLRRAGKHLDQVVVQRVVELPLKLPLKLRVIEIAGMQFVEIGVHRHGAMRELNADLDPVAFGARIEAEQRVLVEAQLGEHAVEAGIGDVGHGGDCNGVSRRASSPQRRRKRRVTTGEDARRSTFSLDVTVFV